MLPRTASCWVRMLSWNARRSICLRSPCCVACKLAEQEEIQQWKSFYIDWPVVARVVDSSACLNNLVSSFWDCSSCKCMWRLIAAQMHGRSALLHDLAHDCGCTKCSHSAVSASQLVTTEEIHTSRHLATVHHLTVRLFPAVQYLFNISKSTLRWTKLVWKEQKLYHVCTYISSPLTIFDIHYPFSLSIFTNVQNCLAMCHQNECLVIGTGWNEFI